MMAEIEGFFRKFIKEISEEEKTEAYEKIKTGIVLSNDFFVMLVLAIIIATLGLLMNNTAVIIGAMLVSPLLTPVLAISLGVVRGDVELFRRGLESEIKGAVLAVIVSIIITLIMPGPIITSEILARIRPTPLDLFIALASGAAGAYAMSRRTVSATLPGIAISTALLPPLGVIGVGIALKMPEIAIGGTLLFLANIIAIDFAASFVFWLLGFSPKWSVETEEETMKKLKVSTILLLVILIPLGWFMWESIRTAETQATIERVINAQIEGIEQARLVEFDFELNNGFMKISVTIDSPKAIMQEKAEEMRVALEKHLKTAVDLDLKVNEVTWIRAEHTKD